MEPEHRVTDHEAWLAETLIGLADTLVADYDVVEYLSVLAERLAELLNAADVGLVLADGRSRLRVMASSSERAQTLELFELQNEEGPCLDCFRNGEQILNADLEAPDQRWEVFAVMARSLGFSTAHAFPLRLRQEIIGAVNVFHNDAHVVTESEARLAQALADMATIGILQARAIRRVTDLAEQLQGALNSRVVIEQAKGVIAEHLSVPMDTAFAMLRSYARANNLRLSDVAQGVTDRRVPVERLQSPRISGRRERHARP